MAAQGAAWRRYWGRNHQLDFGLDLEESKSTEERRILGDFQQLYYPFGIPSEVIEYNTPSHSKQRLRELSFYLDERVRVTDWLFLRAGLALDSSKTFLPPQGSGAGTFVPARQFSGMDSVVSWTTLAPRIGVSVPLSDRLGGTRLSAVVDAFNLLNSNRSLREYDISGPLFPSRTPVEIQNPRVIRFGLRLYL